jgi:hypothetical protein
MDLARPSGISPLAEPIDLGGCWNATDDDVAARFHPLYRSSLARLPDGPSVFRGLPFELGRRAAGRRWILVDREPVTVPIAGDGHRQASHVVLAHFCDSDRDAAGHRPPATPVGWVLPTGQPLAGYRLTFADGSSSDLTVRRRFEIADGIIGWGFLPFEAVGHRADEPVDWRGPYPRLSAGRYVPAGQAGLLGMLPASWGPAQTAVADFVPTPADDITYWLHAIEIPVGSDPVELTLTPATPGRPGSAFVVAAITRFTGTGHPLALEARRQIRIEGGSGRQPEIDLGVVIRELPAAPSASVSSDPDSPIGWGTPRVDEAPVAMNGPRIVDLAAARDARVRIDDTEIALIAIDEAGTSADGGLTIHALPAPEVRVAVRLRADRASTPARVQFVTTDGRYIAPLGHRDEVNPALLEDTGADILLGSSAYAYMPGDFEVDLPIGPVTLEVVKGFEHRPVRLHVEVDASTRELSVDLERFIDAASDGWHTADPHVHYLAPSTALVQAAAEDVELVHLLSTQAGDLVTNGQDVWWGSIEDPSGRHRVVMGTENRQNLLGHLTLLGARTPTLPMAAGGAPEGRLGGAVSELLMDWADRCHAAGGIVVAAHFPLPYAEIAAAIATGRIDAVESQTFAPGLDSPSISEWYRFLNCGYRLPLIGGTDKMSAEVPVGAIRTYARLRPDEPMTPGSWAAAVRAGRTVATSGPFLELSVEGHGPGDLIALPPTGGRVEVRARARAAQPTIDRLELVVNGDVVAAESRAGSSTELMLATSVDLASGAWIAARSTSHHEIRSAFATSMSAHTSPVYVDVPGRPVRSQDDAEAIATVIDGTARWLATLAAIPDATDRRRMVDVVTAAAASLRDRSGRHPGE